MKINIIIILSLLNLFVINNNIKAQTLEHLDSIKFIRYEKALNWIKSDDSIKIINFNFFQINTTEISYKVSDEITNFNVHNFSDDIMDYEFKNQPEGLKDYLEIHAPLRILSKFKELNHLNDIDSIKRKELGDIPCDSFKTIIKNSNRPILLNTDEYWNYGIFFSDIIKNRLRASIVPNGRAPLCLRFYLPIVNSNDCEILFYFDDNNNIIKVFRKCFIN